MSVNGAQSEGATTVTDGNPSASSKRTSWIASLFGAKASTSSNSSQESEEMSEVDGGAKKNADQAKKEEHVSVPSKGKLLSLRANARA